MPNSKAIPLEDFNLFVSYFTFSNLLTFSYFTFNLVVSYFTPSFGKTFLFFDDCGQE